MDPSVFIFLLGFFLAAETYEYLDKANNQAKRISLMMRMMMIIPADVLEHFEHGYQP